ncbi:MAG: DUF3574 domain-containing protein [Gammaproteobacteria bacterium]
MNKFRQRYPNFEGDMGTRFKFRASSVFTIALALGACASNPLWSCRTGERLAVMDSMYFGTVKPGGSVTAQEWQEFMNQVVTPRFPEGLTSWEASGQWQSATGVIEQESSHVLHIVHPDTEESELAVREIMNRYKTEFQQQAVLRVRSRACMSL